MKGIRIGNIHSYKEYGMRMLERSIGLPQKDERTERVPYSNVTYDFSAIYGTSGYGERTLTYKFEFLDQNPIRAHERLDKIMSWLSYNGRKNLYDDMIPYYHFEARCTAISQSESHGVYTVTVTFKANPFKVSDTHPYTTANAPYPDINGDGVVNASDAAEILTAASLIGAGMDSGLTAEQERLADADGDGRITATDAALVQAFIASVGIGEYPNTPEGWVQFRNDSLAQEESL
jgi:hypothetical protein